MTDDKIPRPRRQILNRFLDAIEVGAHAVGRSIGVLTGHDVSADSLPIGTSDSRSLSSRHASELAKSDVSEAEREAAAGRLRDSSAVRGARDEK